MARPTAPLPEIFLTSAELSSRVTRGVRAGRLKKLAPGLYTSNVEEDEKRLVLP